MDHSDTMPNQSMDSLLPTTLAAPAPVTPAQVVARVAHDWPSLDAMSLRYIHEVLDHVGQNKARAARLLGIDRRTLTRILARSRGDRTPSMHTRA